MSKWTSIILMMGIAAAVVVAKNPKDAGPEDAPIRFPLPVAEAKTPQEELKTFRVQEGFEVQLVASEPMVEDPIALSTTDPALLLIQRIRDEAHRFAVTFHRRARAIRDLRSELDHVPGVGARRRKTLLTTFGSLAGVRRATREELAVVVGPKIADAVLAFFASRP